LAVLLTAYIILSQVAGGNTLPAIIFAQYENNAFIYQNALL